MNNEKTTGLIVGGATSAIYWWARNEDERRQRVEDLRKDNRDLRSRLNEWLGSGDWIRLTLPIVRDALTGIAEASAGSSVASPVPNPPTLNRPDQSGGANVAGFSWPPAVPTYDAMGNTNTLGEMAQAFRVLTFPENRAWNQGLTLSAPPSAAVNLQIFYAAQGLVRAIASQNLTLAQYQQAWTNLFAGAGGSSPTPGTGGTAGRHEDPAYAPTASPAYAGLTIVPLTNVNNSVPGYPYANRNTDTVMRFRAKAPVGGVPAGNAIATVSFGSEYRDSQNNPFQPGIPATATSGSVVLQATAVTSTGFTVFAVDSMPADSTHDFTFTVIPGQATK